jgi:HD-GYP domain-containing protein (c-di-GMP phosphodiesterase class II)
MLLAKRAGCDARERIPLVARIMGLTDAFDAMTSTRPYRKGMPVAKALEIIAAHRGTPFDAELSDQLAALAVTVPEFDP